MIVINKPLCCFSLIQSIVTIFCSNACQWHKNPQVIRSSSLAHQLKDFVKDKTFLYLKLTGGDRVGLKTDLEIKSFRDEVEYESSIKLSDIFVKVTNVTVNESDEVKPSRLCKQCTTRLLDAYKFICAVEQAEVEINFLLQQEHEHSEYASLDLQKNNINNMSLERQNTAIGSLLDKPLAGCNRCDRSFAKKQAHTMKDTANISPPVPEST
uniref:ZAD domain-containing protein n=1 Tax=Glossina brevipalpis TaxID=37001 RepID=A0A1A9W6R7_9MUSC